MVNFKKWLAIVFLIGSLLPQFLRGAEPIPRTGKELPAYEPLEKAVIEFMEKIDAHAATVAIHRNGKLVYSRGFGWSDQNKKIQTSPDALMRIASLTKPFTSAAIRNSVREGLFSFDTEAFDFLQIKSPTGKIADPRLHQITIKQLLEHKGGWDSAASFDPMFRVKQIETELNLSGAATPKNVVEYMLTKPLQFDPGQRSAYSNFGYCVLGRVLEKSMKKPYFDCIQDAVLAPLKIKNIRLGHGAANQRDPHEVWYPVADNVFSLDVMDAHGGLIASAPALCRFMDAYWIDGKPRQRDKHYDWTFFGSLPGTTAMMRQRPDDFDCAILLNARRNQHFSADDAELKKNADLAFDQISKIK